jgi:hypothetical protein
VSFAAREESSGREHVKKAEKVLTMESARRVSTSGGVKEV